MPRFVDLSHPLEDGQLVYPGDSPIGIKSTGTVATGGCNLSSISMSSHHGTHLDAPWHFFDEARTLDAIPLDRFFGPAVLIDLAPGGVLPPNTLLSLDMFQQHADAFQPGAKVIYRTGWDRTFGTPEFFTECPALAPEAARWMADRRIGLLGMDTPTPNPASAEETHHALLAEGVEIVIVEGLANLDQLPDRFTFVGFPLNLKGRDGSPIRAVGMIV